MRRLPSPRRRGDRGSVTAEAAIVLPIVVAFVVVLIWLITVGIAQVQVVDAARDTARALARGDEEAAAVTAGLRSAPDDADVAVSRAGATVTVDVTSIQTPPGWLLVPMPSLTIRSSSTVEVEADAD